MSPVRRIWRSTLRLTAIAALALFVSSGASAAPSADTFFDGFKNLSAWNFAPSWPNDGEVTISSVVSTEGGTSAQIDVDTTHGGNGFAARRNLPGGGNPNTVYYLAYALYVPTWGPWWDNGTPESVWLPNFTNFPDFSSGSGSSGYGPLIKATSPVSGQLITALLGPPGTTVSLAAGRWHTVRLAFRLGNGTLFGQTWLNGQSLGSNTQTGFTTGPPVGAWIGNDLSHTIGVYHVDAMTASAGVDPGDPSIPPPPPPNSPDPPLLDDFNRPNETPVSQGGNWALTGIGGGPAALLAGNQLIPSGQARYSYRTAQHAAGDLEAAATISVLPSRNDSLSLFVCVQDAGTAGWDGYELRGTVRNGADLWEIRRIDNGGAPLVLASKSFDLAVQGVMDIRQEGSVVEFWWKPPSGTWRIELSVNDNRYSGGRIGVGGSRSGALDNFAGGSADVSVSQVGWPFGTVGDSVPIRLDITNVGPSPAKLTRLTAVLPAGVTILDASVESGSCAIVAFVECQLGDLSAGITRTATISVTLDAEANLGTSVSVSTTTQDPSPSSNSLVVRTVGLSSTQRLASQFRPALMFDSGSSELWRPVAIDSLLSESFDGERHRICIVPFSCADLTSEDGFTGFDYVDLHGSSALDSYTSHSCRVSGLNDCDTGPASVVYYEPTTDSGTGYRYLDFWWFFRWNDSKFPTGDHEGDWEGLTLAIDPTGPPSNTGPPVAAYALYAAHNTSTWSAYLGDPANAHTPAYIAEGTHASYPSPDFPCGSTPPDERCFDGPVAWGRNNDAECAELCVRPFTAPWLMWPGRWGPNEEGTIEGGESPKSPGWQGRFQCARNLFVGSCTAPPAPSLFSAQSANDAAQAGDSALASCSAWTGPQAAVTLCDAEQLRKSFTNRALDERIASPLDVPGFDGDVVSAPGLTQAIGRPITTGRAVSVIGPVSDERQLTLRIRDRGKRWIGTTRVPQIPAGKKFRVHVKAGATSPELEIELPSGERIRGPNVREENA